jgi:hypothetical protein
MKRRAYIVVVSLLLVVVNLPCHAHHVLGKPAYSHSENSATPPSVQIETQIGKYFVTIMAYPAFPKPNEQGRVHLYASRIENSAPLMVPITFKVRDDTWFSSNQETLGAQTPIENIYKQGFVFSKEGDYIITADFHTDGEPYSIDFPLTVGRPFPVGTIGSVVIFIFIVLISVTLIQRRRLLRLQSSRHQQDASAQP